MNFTLADIDQLSGRNSAASQVDAEFSEILRPGSAPRRRKVSKALTPYALLAISAHRGAGREVD